MPSAIESQGVVIAIDSGASPGNFLPIGNVVSFSGPGGSASVIDTSNLDSVAREKLMGLPDEGQFTLEVNLDPDSVVHQQIKDDRIARTRKLFQMTLTDDTPTVLDFAGFVLSFEISGAVDAVVKASITIEIDGAVAWT